MSLKKKLGMGIGTAILGLSLVGGGTFAYFSDTAVSENTFAAGTLDLSVNPTTIVDIGNLKPGDTIERTFEFENNGTLDISKVLLETDYKVDGAYEFGEHIVVNFLENKDKSNVIIESKTLKELKDMSPDAAKALMDSVNGPKSGLEVGEKNNLRVQFEFRDNGENQNHLQGAHLELKWTFNAEQTAGEKK